MALYFYGFVLNSCLWKEKPIIQEKLPKPQWKSVLSYMISYSHTFFRSINRVFCSFLKSASFYGFPLESCARAQWELWVGEELSADLLLQGVPSTIWLGWGALPSHNVPRVPLLAGMRARQRRGGQGSRKNWEGTAPPEGEAPGWAIAGSAHRDPMLLPRQPGRHPGLKGDAAGRVYTCCLCFLRENILEMPPSAPWTNTRWLPQGCTGCNKLLLQGVYPVL